MVNTLLEHFHDVRYSYVYIESLVLLGIEGAKEEDADLDISLTHVWLLTHSSIFMLNFVFHLYAPCLLFLLSCDCFDLDRFFLIM